MQIARLDPDRGAPATSSGTLDDLRRQIAALERRPAAFDPRTSEETARVWELGLEAVDAALPAEGLAADGLHEAAGAAWGDTPAAGAFLAVLLRRLRRRDGREAVLLCQSREAADRFGRAHGPGLADLGLDPGRLLLVRARRDRDVLWALEEGLRAGALAAQEGSTPALLLRHDELGPASAALSRWRVAALPGRADPFDSHAPGRPRWRLELARCRGGRPATFDVEWSRETGDFGLAAALADRPAAPVRGTAAGPGRDLERKAG